MSSQQSNSTQNLGNSNTIEFWFDIVSPASYLAWTQMPELAKETGANIRYRPFFLPGIFQETGNSSPITVPAKGKWMFHDFRRWAKRYGVPFWMNEHFPLSSLSVMRGLIAWQNKPELVALGSGFFQAMWAENKNVSDPEIVAEIVQNAGAELTEWQAAIKDPSVKQQVFDITAEGVERGVFGAPTFFVNGEMHWGQDRLDFVKDAFLKGAA